MMHIVYNVPLKEETRYNKICTNEEYLAQGFKLEELDKIRRHDELFNLNHDGLLSEEEKEEMFDLVDELGL